MSSTHAALTATFNASIDMLTDGDPRNAASVRAPLELVHDNTGYLLAQLATLTTQLEAYVLQTLIVQCIRCRKVSQDGTTITDTAESMAAVQRVHHGTVLIAKTAQSFWVGDSDRFTVQGVPTSITSLVTDAASNGTRLLLVGTGGNRCSYSDDDGVTWNTGGNIGATPVRLVWNVNKGKFLVGTGTDDVRFSTDGTSWTLGTSATCEVGAGLAVLAGGAVYGVNVVNAVRRSTDGGSTWTGTGGNVYTPSTLDDSGSVAGDEGIYLYHAGRHSSGTSLLIARSPDGVTWAQIGSFSPPPGTTFSARPRIMMCNQTSLLVVVAPLSDNRIAIFGGFQSGAWAGPLVPSDVGVGVNAFAVAGGRLFYTHNDMMLAADGYFSI